MQPRNPWTDWQRYWLIVWRPDRLTDWLINRSIDRSTDWLTDWLEQWEIKTYVVSDHLDKQLPWNEWLQRMVKTPSTDSSCKVKHESCITIKFRYVNGNGVKCFLNSSVMLTALTQIHKPNTKLTTAFDSSKHKQMHRSKILNAGNWIFHDQI